MNEYSKIEEAEYFLDKMISQKSNYDIFKNNLSAFLASSRSVFQFAYDELKNNIDGKKWYETKVSSSKIIKYLKEKRDINIHTEPVQTKSNIIISATASLQVSHSIKVNGIVTSTSESKNSHATILQNNVKVDAFHRFKDWSGDEDIITLCNNYLYEIELFVNEGIQLGYITK
jgi:hypothetical protein